MASICSYVGYNEEGDLISKINQVRKTVQIRSIFEAAFDKLYQAVGGFRAIDKKSVVKFCKNQISQLSYLPQGYRKILNQIIGRSFMNENDMIPIGELQNKIERIIVDIIEDKEGLVRSIRNARTRKNLYHTIEKGI